MYIYIVYFKLNFKEKIQLLSRFHLKIHKDQQNKVQKPMGNNVAV